MFNVDKIEFKTLKKEEYKVGHWTGGITTQLAIYPAAADYGDRNFIWRLSSATVEVEESDFTPLPDYDRVLIVLKGEVVLVHKEKRVARLAQYEQERFSGAYDTKSYGKITDFNLMVRKGNQGYAEVINLTEEYRTLKMEEASGYKRRSQGFYCTEGFCAINFNKESCMVREGELFLINSDFGEINEIGIMGEGKVIRTHVYFNEEENNNESGSEPELPSEKVKAKITAEDLKWAAIICWSNFRGGKYIFKGLRNIWYDEALQKGIDTIDRIFLPFFIGLLGVGAVGFYGWENFQSNLIAPAILLWIILDVLLINPLLYLAVLPRPIKSHIKKITELTENERAVFEKQKAENKQADKILKKYEITGRNKYID